MSKSFLTVIFWNHVLRKFLYKSSIKTSKPKNKKIIIYLINLSGIRKKSGKTLFSNPFGCTKKAHKYRSKKNICKWPIRVKTPKTRSVIGSKLGFSFVNPGEIMREAQLYSVEIVVLYPKMSKLRQIISYYVRLALSEIVVFFGDMMHCRIQFVM